MRFEVHKNAKRQRGQYPAILTILAWSIKDLLYGIMNKKEEMIFVLVYFRTLKRKPVVNYVLVRFGFLVFYYYPDREIRENLFTVTENIDCGNITDNPARALPLHLARSGSQSQRGIWFILPARRACHIIKVGIVS